MNPRSLLCWLALLGQVSTPFTLQAQTESDMLVQKIADEKGAEHFKYGSIGQDHLFATPYYLWELMPKLCKDLLPKNGKKGWEAFGLIVEKGRSVPIGLSVFKNPREKFARVGLNCAACHSSKVRATPEANPQIILGMPAVQFKLDSYLKFMSTCALDETRFSFDRVKREVLLRNAHLPIHKLNRKIARLRMAHKILVSASIKSSEITDQIMSGKRQPLPGPGRVDTFAPFKLIFAGQESLEKNDIGNVDAPSIYGGKLRTKEVSGIDFPSHWDGGVLSRIERNTLATLGSTAKQVFFLTKRHMRKNISGIYKVESFLENLDAPKYPLPVDKSRAERGRRIYNNYCMSCHGSKAQRYGHEKVQPNQILGTVVDIEDIKTSRYRLDHVSNELYAHVAPYLVKLNGLNPTIKQTNGYLSNYLDGIYLRGPYLHNGSVPTIMDLLTDEEDRPKAFYRGSNILDTESMGYLSELKKLKKAKERIDDLFLYDTSLPGNSNQGHSGEIYGTKLDHEEKLDLIEYLKEF